MKITVVLLALLLCLGFASAKLHRIMGPLPGQHVRKVHARTFSDPVASGRDQSTYRVLDIHADLKVPVVAWSELSQDRVSILRCAPISTLVGSTSVQLGGADVEIGDFPRATVFAISRLAWRTHCRSFVPTVPGIPPNDEMLFLRIESSNLIGTSAEGVSLNLRMVSRRVVAPKMNVRLLNTVTKKGGSRPASSFQDDSSPSAAFSRVVSANDLLLPTIIRPAITYKKTITLSSSAQLTVNSRLSMGMEKFDIDVDVGFFSVDIKGSWEQFIDASASTTLKYSRTVSQKLKKQLLKQSVPGLGWGADIWLIGRVGVGAFVKVDFVADVKASVGLTATANAFYKKREKVEFNIGKLTMDARRLSSSGGGGASVSFGNTFAASLDGFAGLRPAVGAEVSLGSKLSVEGNVGASVGVLASIKSKSSAFTPYTGRGLKIGVCNRCHLAQGELSVKGKDLGVEFIKGGGKPHEKVLLKSLFEKKIATVCVIARSCPAATPSPSPFPRPKKCSKYCRTRSDCASSEVCEGSYCKKLVARGRCDECTKCLQGACRSNGFCKFSLGGFGNGSPGGLRADVHAL